MFQQRHKNTLFMPLQWVSFSQRHYPNIIVRLNALLALHLVHAYFTDHTYCSCQRNLHTWFYQQVPYGAWQRTRLQKDILAGLYIGLRWVCARINSSLANSLVSHGNTQRLCWFITTHSGRCINWHIAPYFQMSQWKMEVTVKSEAPNHTSKYKVNLGK